MDTITFNQAIVVLLFAKGDYDETNVAPAFARAQEAILKHGPAGLDLDKPLHHEEVDDLLIFLLETGRVKI